MVKSLSFPEIATLVQGAALFDKCTEEVQAIFTDTRKIIHAEGALFIALKGFKVDGYDFIPEAMRLGVKCFIVEREVPLEEENLAYFIQVADSMNALQRLARWNREQFANPVVAITGSNGKTIVKEWLGQLLATKYSIAKSPKSYNSQSGVPLSIFGIEAHHQAAILEAGISKRGEMEKLEKMIRPDVGVFTNIGTAHAEGFEDQEEKLKEKALLFDASSYVIYRKDQYKVHHYFSTHFAPGRLISWSDQPGADYTLSVRKEVNGSKIMLIGPELGMYTFRCKFTDEASLENLRHCIVAALTLGMTAEEIQAVIPQLGTVEMRLTLKAGIHQCLLIDDTYNNDLAGLDIALEFLQHQRPKSRKILLLSDLLQAGNKELVYQRVRELLVHYSIDLLIGVGNDIKVLRENLPCKSLFYNNTGELLNALDGLGFQNDLILIKGARAFSFERVVNALQERLHGTVLEINLNALRRNFSFYKERLNPTTKVMVMVKAFAYGGGATEIAHHLQQLRADYLAVAYTDEGVALRQENIQLPIMVLNPAPESFENLVKFHLEPVVYSPAFFRQLGEFCGAINESLPIHLDLDTGMHRLGFGEEDMEALKDLVSAYPALRIASLYTHLAGADEAVHEEFSLEQLERFQRMANHITTILGYSPLRHALNSAGIVRYPAYQMEMVRLGIGLYGVEVNGLHDEALQPVSSLKTTVSQIKSLKAGETVGYSRKGVMAKAGKIATIAIGYADGYDRRFSNGKGQVMINGQKAPVIGNVCMDMTMIDITGLEVKEGDEVLIYGAGLSLKEQANAIGTIPYELLTNISGRVKRVYFMD